MHRYDEKLDSRSYIFIVRTRFKNNRRLAQQNRHEGCQALLVKTKQFVQVPFDSENLVVKSITKNLSRGFRAYKLKISFCDHFGNPAGEPLVFDPIVSLQHFDWWDPRYDEIVNN